MLHEPPALACGCGGDGVQTKTIISPKCQTNPGNQTKPKLTGEIMNTPKRVK